MPQVLQISEEKNAIHLTRKQFAEATIVLEGKPFSLYNFPMFHKIYSAEFPELLLKCGRQVGKTVTEHNLMFIESAAIPGFRHLYVSPSQEQTRRFSVSKLQKTLNGSKDLKALLLGPHHRCNVSHQMYSNGSEVFLSYAGDDANRIRGISSDRNHYDEIQDIPYDGVVPVINECLSKSDFKYITYAGTPKSNDNTIEYIWQLSTQNEWAVHCESCKHWNMYINTEGLGKRGIICIKCKRYVNPYLARWISLNKNSAIHGFHIPQVILPENNPITAKTPEEYHVRLANWQRILRKTESGEYSETAFMNEVLGVSVSQGTRLLSLDELKAMRKNHDNLKTPSPYFNPRNHRLIFAGIDWGGNGKEGVSRTALTIFALNYDATIRLLYYRIYPIENPLDSYNDIVKTMKLYQVACVGADAGEGTLANPLLRRDFGHDNVYPIRYMPIKRVLEWDDTLHQGCYKANRTALIDNFAFLLKKKGGIEYPKDTQADALFNDMLAIFEETTKTGAKIWNNHPRMPTDGLHSQVFGWAAMKIRTQDLMWYVAE